MGYLNAPKNMAPYMEYFSKMEDLEMSDANVTFEKALRKFTL